MYALKRFHVKLPLGNHNITIILYMVVKRCHFLTCLKRILWSQACINIVLNISLACTNHYRISISLQWGPSRSNTKPMAKLAQSRMENNTLTYDCDNGNAVALPHILVMSERGGEKTSNGYAHIRNIVKVATCNRKPQNGNHLKYI